MAPEIVESFSGEPAHPHGFGSHSSSLRRFFCLGNRTEGLSCCGYEWSRRHGRSTNGGRKNDASSATLREGGRVRSVNGHLPLVPFSFPVRVLASAARRGMRKGPLTFRSFRIRTRKKWLWLFCWASPSSYPGYFASKLKGPSSSSSSFGTPTSMSHARPVLPSGTEEGKRT